MQKAAAEATRLDDLALVFSLLGLPIRRELRQTEGSQGG
jgi:hypothetical protein